MYEHSHLQHKSEHLCEDLGEKQVDINDVESGYGASNFIGNQPESHALHLPDEHGRLKGEEEIPEEIAAEMYLMLDQLKRTGQIPQNADPQQMMITMHREMMKEKDLMQQMAQKTQIAQNSSEKASILHPAAQSAQLGQPLMQLEDAQKISSKAKQQLCAKHEHHQNSFGVGNAENMLSKTSAMLNQNPNAINDKDENGNTLLHHACRSGQESLVQLLLMKGADPNVLNNKRQTSVHFAAQNGQILILQLLSTQGVDMKAVDFNGWTAMHHAAHSSMSSSSHTLHFLHECHGLSYSSLTNDRQSLLHLACQHKDNQLLVKMLLNNDRVDVGLTDVNGCNALHYATALPDAHICWKIVCRGGAKMVLITNKEGQTPLDIARRSKSLTAYYLSKAMDEWIVKGENFKPHDSTPQGYYMSMYLPTVCFLFSYLLAVYLTPESQGWLVVLGNAIMCYLVFFKSVHRVDDTSKLPDPSKKGAFLGAMLIAVYVFLKDCLPVVYETRPLTVLIMVVLIVVGNFQYYQLLIFDPGFNLESKRKESGELYTMKDLVNTFKKPLIWCASCELIPTKPSKHCRLCDRCVYWMDHHCLYTMNCVGHKNHRIFLLFNISILVLQCLLISLIYDLPPVNVSMFEKLQLIFHTNGLLFVVLVMAFFWISFTGSLLFQSLSNVSCGYTAIFQPKQNSVTGLTLGDKVKNVFSFLLTGKIIMKDPFFTL